MASLKSCRLGTMVKPIFFDSMVRLALAKWTTVEMAMIQPQMRWIEPVGVDAAQGVHHRLGPAGRVELLRQAGQAQGEEDHHGDEVLDALLEREADDVGLLGVAHGWLLGA